MSDKVLPVATFSPEELAKLARLRYVTDEQPGYRREKNGQGFYYLNLRGRRLRGHSQITRIETLAVPPAWTDVWICRFAAGHLQATGRDDRQRKQYIYHERWREISNLAKFWRLKDCAQFLPRLRRRVRRDLGGRGLTQNRVLAGMVGLLDLTSIRIGNEEYVRQNNSYGLATLRTRHVAIGRGRALLRFRGKSGLRREATVDDKQLVRLLRELKKLPGQHVFQYVDEEGRIHPVDATLVNDYLRERSSHPFTAKDFRTWKGSAVAAGVLYDRWLEEKLSVRKKTTKAAIALVSEALGNTPTVCRKYYIHCGLVDCYLDAKLTSLFKNFRARRRKALSRDEQILTHFLRHWSPVY
jgi:DNA topoisomerase-1